MGLLLLSLRCLIAFSVFCLGTIILVILCLFRPCHPSNCLWFGATVGVAILKVYGLDVTYRGLEKLKGTHSTVLLSNHQNNFDLFILSTILPAQTSSLGKKSILWIPFFGLYYVLSGNILIDRSNRKKSMQSMEKVRRALVEKKHNIIVMPEGTRSRGRGLLPFKKGAFRTAIRAQSALRPIIISDMRNLNLKKCHAGKVIVEVLDEIPTKGLSDGDIQNLMDKTYALMKEHYDRVNQEIG